MLTLTATPIPRTLHMSLVGVRDISNLETPPEDRLATETLITLHRSWRPELAGELQPYDEGRLLSFAFEMEAHAGSFALRSSGTRGSSG